MREILFRGKRINSGEWVEGYFFEAKNVEHDDARECYIIPLNAFISTYLEVDYSFVDPDTIGQYTGLKDKNGNRIFEGDILQFGEKRLVVWWNGEAFQWQAKEHKEVGVTYIGISTYNIDLGWIYAEVPCTGEMSTEIIGNIHDNPELMEVQDG